MRRHGEFKGFMVERLMRRVGQYNGHLVFSGGQSHQNHRLTAGVRPVPGRVIHHNVNMADARSDFQRIGSKDRFYAQVFNTVLNKDSPLTQRACQRRIDNQPGGWLGLLKRGNGSRTVDVGGAEIIQWCPQELTDATARAGSNKYRRIICVSLSVHSDNEHRRPFLCIRDVCCGRLFVPACLWGVLDTE